MLRYAVQTDHETARRVELGMECCECAEPFVRAHGFVTACAHCWPKLTAAEQAKVQRASHEEATAAFFANAARKRRKAKESKSNG